MSDAPADRCPYVGLRPFTDADQAFFFGRRSETRVVSANLFAAPLTVFYGPSAVGKSSVLRAGVIPRLRGEPRTAVLYFRDWQHDDYLDRMKRECARAMELSSGKRLDIDDTLPWNDWIDRALEQFRGQLHVLLDQFEEYLLYHGESSPTAFDGELAAAINRRDIGARFLIGLREDGLAKLDRFRPRIPNLLGNTLRLRRLSLAAARDAIESPLRVYNEKHPGDSPVVIEPALVDDVLAQVRADQVTTTASSGEGSVHRPEAEDEVETAYLQLVMERLWLERVPDNGHVVIPLKAFTVLGGAKAIAKSHFTEHLDRLTAAAPNVVGDLVCDLFAHLVTPTGSKISQKEGDLVALTSVPPESVLWFLRELVAARLLRVTDPPEKYEIFHDALAKPFLEARTALVLRRATEARDAELKRAQAMADAERARADAEKERAEAQAARAEAEARRVSEQEAATRRVRRYLVVASALAVLATASAIAAFLAYRDAAASRAQANELRAIYQKLQQETAQITEQLTTQVREIQARNDDLIKNSALTVAEREKALGDSQNAKDEIAKITQQYQNVQKSVTDANSIARDLSTARSQIATLQKERDDARETVKTATGDIAALRKESQQFKDSIATLQKERDDARETLKKAGDNAALQKENQQLRDSIAAAQKENQQLKDSIAAAQKENQQLKETVAALEKKLGPTGGGGGAIGTKPPAVTAALPSGLSPGATYSVLTANVVEFEAKYGRDFGYLFRRSSSSPNASVDLSRTNRDRVFRAGLDAFDRGSWQTAADALFVARIWGDAGESFFISAGRSTLFVPTMYYGLALKELKRCDEALAAWSALSASKLPPPSSREYKQLEAGRTDCKG